jgi:hypothetical protein
MFMEGFSNDSIKAEPGMSTYSIYQIDGMITPADRSGNRYMVNFIDYKSNYCRVFLAKTKDQAA